MPDPQHQAPRHTPLTAVHQGLDASMTEFAGWLMPLRYRSETAEHNAVRNAAGLFDLSHMGELFVTGPGAAEALDYALVGAPSQSRPGRARYTMICAADGGVIDDLIVYRLADDEFLVVANAANTPAVASELGERARGFEAQVTDRTQDYALIAVQGPRSAGILAALTDFDLGEVRYYASYPATVAGRPSLLARTGYTGEDGFEIMLPGAQAERLWQALNSAGVASCGLGARDTLRLEAGMNLYGSDMDEGTHPFESGLAWTVALEPRERAFIGRESLEAIRARGPQRKLVGLLLEARGVLRSHQRVVVPDAGEGEITSGTFSPTLERSIALARVPAAAGSSVQVDIRGKLHPARVVRPPFVRHGKALIS
jgi:aminomethyltransferase